MPFGVPFAPTPFRVDVPREGGQRRGHARKLPVQFRYVKDIYIGDKRMELNVVPAFSVRVTPPLAVIPSPRQAGRRQPSSARSTSRSPTARRARRRRPCALELPAGWTRDAGERADRASRTRTNRCRRASRSPRRAQVKTGEYTVARRRRRRRPPATSSFATGYQEIEYPHVQRRQVIKPAETTLKVVDVKIAPNLNVGYVVGVGDQVPPAIEQLGAKLTFIDQDELAWGDLSKYDVDRDRRARLRTARGSARLQPAAARLRASAAGR